MAIHMGRKTWTCTVTDIKVCLGRSTTGTDELFIQPIEKPQPCKKPREIVALLETKWTLNENQTNCLVEN